MHEGKIALIIGGTGGIGSAIAKLFCSQGMAVYATYFRNSEKAKQMQEGLKNCTVLQCDISKEEQIRTVVEQIAKNGQKIDIVVNAATSALKLKLFETLTGDEFLEDFNAILLGSINVFRQVVPLMKKNNSGVIINILTSAIVDAPPTRMSSYVTAKTGLAGLSRSLAAELAPYNIRIVGISPSFVETRLISAFPDKMLEIEREKQPDRRLLQPEDIAAVALAVAGSPDKYPNSSNVVVRGRKDV
jgi:3-oxoacyl-[acyl-carrier protein] reductase